MLQKHHFSIATKQATKLKLRTIVKEVPFCSTQDAWTSVANMNYITNTIHIFDQKTWPLHHSVLGLFQRRVLQRLQMWCIMLKILGENLGWITRFSLVLLLLVGPIFCIFTAQNR